MVPRLAERWTEDPVGRRLGVEILPGGRCPVALGRYGSVRHPIGDESKGHGLHGDCDGGVKRAGAECARASGRDEEQVGV